MNPLSKCLTAALAAIALSIGGALLDGPSDTEAAQDVADEAEYAAALADGGKAQCAALGRTPKWTPEGDLVCQFPKATTQLVVAQQGRL